MGISGAAQMSKPSAPKASYVADLFRIYGMIAALGGVVTLGVIAFIGSNYPFTFLGGVILGIALSLILRITGVGIFIRFWQHQIT
jgi:hypothetical protein